MELPYYRYEFERQTREVLEAKRRSDGWLNESERVDMGRSVMIQGVTLLTD